VKRSLILSLVIVLVASLRVEASLTLNVGDVAKYLGHAYDIGNNPLFEGNGGAFSWVLSSTHSPLSSPTNTAFQTFCVELTQTISTGSPGPYYKVSSVFTPTVGSFINSSSSTLGNLQGIYLFDLWSANKITQNATNAGVVQAALWESEGYSDSQIASALGISTFYLNNTVDTSIQTFLGVALSTSTSYSNYSPSDVVAFDLKTLGGSGAQDQIVLGTVGGSNNGSVPEPVSLAVWGIGAGLAAGSVALRRKQPNGRWSKKNRQAILQVIKHSR
jgi:hypothetical protein